jgi:hypothetical protein
MPIYYQPIIRMFGVVPSGSLDGHNRSYSLPERVDPTSVEVFHNGRRLARSADASPKNGEFYVYESTVGGGYDSFSMTSFSPAPGSTLLVDYNLE